ncbi:TetR family transcriptional regulator [Leucobacter allii]|uniref:TetR family transcriptional regulator n=1 Tax=Leucobacter allii TaxID=2932247 RepID=A0ABY4FH31_9MICO|nr:TetR/AcrR family transcriptional regulator [Leucobacter allii]UOQ55956.1 TetR family transcriptional regulator [Leucobacter allii]UOR00472.1 TetR family transcriptional regulator [Leucobacter allii]
MARPSVADERREQIIDATLRTIVEHGISGTTLDRIADAAGMSRGHVRHFVGNRDQLLLDTARAFYADDQGALAVLPGQVQDLDGAVDHLFGEVFAATGAENAIVFGFVDLARTTPEIAAVLTQAYSSARRRLAELIAVAKPHLAPEMHEVAAQGVLTAALGNVFLGDFDPAPDRTARTRAAVEHFLDAL